jgi:hypothetical protein
MHPSPELVTQAFSERLRACAKTVLPNSVSAVADGQNVRFAIRLTSDGAILPSADHLNKLIQQGVIGKGSVPGADKMLIGLVQTVGGQSRITARIVKVETAVIEATAKADVAATKTGLSQGMENVLCELLPVPQPS